MELSTQTHFRQGWNPRLLTDIEALGINTIRDSLAWHKIETVKGKYDFSLDTAKWIDRAVAADIDVVLVFDPHNGLYDKGFSVYSKAGLAAFAAFVVATLKAFPGVAAIEIGNEYNGNDFVDGPVADAPKAERDNFYHRLVSAVDQALDAAGIATKVIGGATHSIPVDYFGKLEANGTLDLLDGVSIHPYTTAPEQFADQLGLLRATIGDQTEIHVTEFSSRFDRPQDTSAYIAKMVSVMAASDVTSASWYAFAKQSAYPNRELWNQVTDKATLGGHTFAMLEDMLAGGAQVDQIATDAYTYFYRFGTDSAIIWGEKRSAMLADGVEAFDLAGNRITDFTELSPEMPVVLRSVHGISAASVTLGANYLLADTYHDFDVTNTADNGSGFEGPWSYFAENGKGKSWALKTSGGDIGGGQPWTPYLGLDWLLPFQVGANSVTPVEFDAGTNPLTEYAVVERFTAERGGTVTIRGSWDVANHTKDGVELRIEVNGKVLFRKVIFDTANGHVFDLTLEGIRLKAGDTIDFVIDPRTTSDGDITTRRVQIFSGDAPDSTFTPAKSHDPVLPSTGPGGDPANPFDQSGATERVELVGTAFADEIFGGSGNDRLEGGGGEDLIFGGDGNDTIIATADTEQVEGGIGTDTVYFTGTRGVAFDIAEANVERVYGTQFADTLDAFGDRDAITIEGAGGDDSLIGGRGNDRLWGESGNDRLRGNQGDDQLDGGGGNDVITGGSGNDRLVGGTGFDVFVFDDDFGRDRIVDFAQGDLIDLSAIRGVDGMADITISYRGKTATITIGQDTITLDGVRGGLDAADFLF